MYLAREGVWSGSGKRRSCFGSGYDRGFVSSLSLMDDDDAGVTPEKHDAGPDEARKRLVAGVETLCSTTEGLEASSREMSIALQQARAEAAICSVVAIE